MAAMSCSGCSGHERLDDDGSRVGRQLHGGWAIVLVGLDLPDLVAFVLQELQLDIEVSANDYRPLGASTF